MLPHCTYVFAADAATASASACATNEEPAGQSGVELMRLEVETAYSGVTWPLASLQPEYGVPASRETAPFSPASSKAT